MKTLLIRPGGIGDCIVSLPAMAALQSDVVEVWTNAACIPIVPFGRRARCATARGIFLLHIAAYPPAPGLASELSDFDGVYSWYGIRERVAQERLRELCKSIDFLDEIPPAGCGQHAIDFYCDRVEKLIGRRIDYRIPSVRVAGVPAPGRQGVILRPFASGERKQWPLERFLQLARSIGERTEVIWLLRPSEELPFDAAPGRICRVEELDETAGRLRDARMYIGNDTGVSHLAAAVGTHVVVLFGPTDPVIWSPRGVAPVKIVRSNSGRIADVTFETVLAAANELLEVAPRETNG